VNIGKLRHRVTIQNKVTLPDGYGGVTSTWQDVATVWASVEPLNGRELYAAQQVKAELTHRITMRYLAGVKPEMRVLFGNRTFAIEAVIDPEERRKVLQLLCAEVVT
jgi:SPP1 family predicted phage head-tail adaptor